jgi:catechol 2,3-dioxygenase-like lactoylglutathione lyase family enzyme
MKRLHVHVSVEDLEKSIGFYSALFGAKPTKIKIDYAKWMLDDPRVNFAISTRAATVGVDHLGIQVDAPEELTGLRDQMKRADLAIFDEGESTCCYAESDKSWVLDPNGIAWEAYHTMADSEIFTRPKANGTSCCAPKVEAKPMASCAPGSACC